MGPSAKHPEYRNRWSFENIEVREESKRTDVRIYMDRRPMKYKTSWVYVLYIDGSALRNSNTLGKKPLTLLIHLIERPGMIVPISELFSLLHLKGDEASKLTNLGTTVHRVNRVFVGTGARAKIVRDRGVGAALCKYLPEDVE